MCENKEPWYEAEDVECSCIAEGFKSNWGMG